MEKNKEKRFFRGKMGTFSMSNGELTNIGYNSSDSDVGQLSAKIARQLYPEYSNLQKFSSSQVSLFEFNADLINPGFVLYVNEKNRDKNARKFKRFINEIENKICLKKKTSIVIPKIKKEEGQKSAPFISKASQWWIKTPLNFELYVDLIRLTPFMKLGEPVDKFFERMKERLNNEPMKRAFRSISKIEKAKKNKVFTRMMMGTLKAQNRFGFSDWLLSDERGKRSYSNYIEAKDNFPMEETEMYHLRVTSKIEKKRKEAGLVWA